MTDGRRLAWYCPHCKADGVVPPREHFASGNPMPELPELLAAAAEEHAAASPACERDILDTTHCMPFRKHGPNATNAPFPPAATSWRETAAIRRARAIAEAPLEAGLLVRAKDEVPGFEINEPDSEHDAFGRVLAYVREHGITLEIRGPWVFPREEPAPRPSLHEFLRCVRAATPEEIMQLEESFQDSDWVAAQILIARVADRVGATDFIRPDGTKPNSDD